MCIFWSKLKKNGESAKIHLSELAFIPVYRPIGATNVERVKMTPRRTTFSTVSLCQIAPGILTSCLLLWEVSEFSKILKALSSYKILKALSPFSSTSDCHMSCHQYHRLASTLIRTLLGTFCRRQLWKHIKFTLYRISVINKNFILPLCSGALSVADMRNFFFLNPRSRPRWTTMKTIL